MPAPADATTATLTLLFWNIRAGGGPVRAQRVLLELLEHRPDLIALAECRPTFAGQLAAALRDLGMPHRLEADAGPRTNRVVLLSRSPLEPLAPPETRLVRARAAGLVVTACHIPDASDRPGRLRLLARLHQVAAAHRDQPHVIIGDFNANRADHPRRDGRAIGGLAALGYSDLWLHCGGAATDPTWVGPRRARARIDHAYASKPLDSRAETAAHLHAPRDAGLSDHSLLKIRIIHTAA